MEKKKLVSIGLIGIMVVSLAVAVTANSQDCNTPLYMVRMEQASNKMSFLPTEKNSFTYITEKGYTLNYGTVNYCGTNSAEPQNTRIGGTYYYTCWETCSGYTCGGSCYTCGGPSCVTCHTCFTTCQSTCSGWTCDVTGCQNTCSTCGPTCPVTCQNTCDGLTCPFVSCKPATCWDSCIGTCDTCDDC